MDHARDSSKKKDSKKKDSKKKDSKKKDDKKKDDKKKDDKKHVVKKMVASGTTSKDENHGVKHLAANKGRKEPPKQALPKGEAGCRKLINFGERTARAVTEDMNKTIAEFCTKEATMMISKHLVRPYIHLAVSGPKTCAM